MPLLCGRDEVVEVETVLWQSYEVYCVVFDYYASLGGNMHALGLNVWTQFLTDFNLVQKRSKFCKQSDMDRLFLAVDTASTRLEKKQAALGGLAQMAAFDDAQKALNRTEFLFALILLSINRYVLPGKIVDVSEALQRLLDVDIQSRVGPSLLAPSNHFRRSHCYTEGVSEELLEKERELRLLFTVVSGGGRGREAELLSLKEWKDMLRALNLIQADLTDRDATLCFVWSRMVVIDPRTRLGHLKESHLPFEGFLEAICRLAILKGLPTDREIEASEWYSDESPIDAAEYFERFSNDSPDEYQAFIEEHATPWGGTPQQPTHRCVAHLVSIIIRTIKVISAGNPETPLSQHDVEKWAKKAKLCSS